MHLLQQPNEQTVPIIDNLCMPQFFGRLIVSSFEYNAIGIWQQNPLCSEIFKAELKHSQKGDLIQCL